MTEDELRAIESDLHNWGMIDWDQTEALLAAVLLLRGALEEIERTDWLENDPAIATIVARAALDHREGEG